MTQLFSSGPSTVTTEKRGNFAGISWKHSNEHGHIPTKIKNFFRINTSGNHGTNQNNGNSNNNNGSNNDRDQEKDGNHQRNPSKSDTKSTFRQSRFLPVIGRNRSVTVASEGNPLDDGVSPTATANPYFAHQGQPSLQHRDEGSIPSSPPGTPELRVEGVSAKEQASTANKQELARKLRRVASAPNTQGLFNSANVSENVPMPELSKDSSADSTAAQAGPPGSENGLDVPEVAQGGNIPSPGQIRSQVGFRRTYSSSSIKVSNVEVGPGSFDKVKLIGKGDVGKVYLVREKKSGRLYAMKGTSPLPSYVLCYSACKDYSTDSYC